MDPADSRDTDTDMAGDIMDQDLHLIEMFDETTEPKSNPHYSLRARVKHPVRFQ